MKLAYVICKQMTGTDTLHIHTCSLHAVTNYDFFLPWAVVGTSKQPAVPGLLDQHINYLSPIEGQQGGVGANRLVGHPGLHDSSSTTTTTSC